MNPMLLTLIRYQTWADAAFFDKLALVDPHHHEAEYRTALALLDHIHVVAQIFAAHLAGRPHAFQSDTSDPTPPIDALREATAQTNQWYFDYAGTLREEALAERIAFTFTDGDRGCLSREEMLMHVLLHGAVHRGEVGRILSGISASIPWDTFAVFLHQSEPARREAAPALRLSA